MTNFTITPVLKRARTTSYVFTADPNSASDMMQINVIKKTVRSMNEQAKASHYWSVKRAEYNGEPIPQAPKKYRVRLMGRGPRRVAAIADGQRKYQYDSYLPQAHATRFDVYIAEVR